jgi:hypothetical protein
MGIEKAICRICVHCSLRLFRKSKVKDVIVSRVLIVVLDSLV